MKKVFFLLSLILTSSFAGAQDDDPIVMHINEQPVPRSEFEYNFNKNNTDGVIDKKNVEEYAQLFINYKLKVLAAEDAKLDTLSSFQKEFRTYRDQQIRPLLLPQTAMDDQCRKYYDRMVESLQGKCLLKPAHIFIRVPQQADAALQEKAKNKIDSIYQALKNGADFATLAKNHSEDPNTAVRGGELPWIGPNQTLKEFEDKAYSLEVNTYSEPFLSTVGYHIVKLLDKKELESYETLEPNIHKFLESQGLEERLSAQVLDSISKSSQKSVEEILDEETERLCAKDSDLKYLVKEYHDGLLLFELCNREVWEPAAKDTTGIENYFKSHKKQYAWEEPHFDGMVYYCKDKADIKKVKKLLKKVDSKEWVHKTRETFNADSVTVRMEQQLFKLGDNANVDVLAFKKKEKKIEPIEGFPYGAVLGKVLKKGPDSWTQIGNQVVTDYQHAKEAEFVEKLREKYTVEIHEDVLKTVNNH